MEFRDLKKQYNNLKDDIDCEIENILLSGNFISGEPVKEIERMLAEYVGVKHCITCANGTDALSLALRTWKIGEGDAVFVPDFTFFSSGETVALAGATPIFVDVSDDSFNMSVDSLENAIRNVLAEGILIPKVIVTVDLFGQPADYDSIVPIAEKYGLRILEDGAQGFGGNIRGKHSCGFGDIATTSFFPAKPLGCYGDGGAVFTNQDDIAEVIRSLCVHGKGADKYDNVRIGVNSRLDTIQAGVLKVKLKAFTDYELEDVNKVAFRYSELLRKYVKVPKVNSDFYSCWAQYTILLDNQNQRDNIQALLKTRGIPSMIYYRKPMHMQAAFSDMDCVKTDLSITESICNRVLSLPLHPYMTIEEQDYVVRNIRDALLF